jgi:hypothetical protein
VVPELGSVEAVIKQEEKRAKIVFGGRSIVSEEEEVVNADETPWATKRRTS